MVLRIICLCIGLATNRRRKAPIASLRHHTVAVLWLLLGEILREWTCLTRRSLQDTLTMHIISGRIWKCKFHKPSMHCWWQGQFPPASCRAIWLSHLKRKPQPRHRKPVWISRSLTITMEKAYQSENHKIIIKSKGFKYSNPDITSQKRGGYCHKQQNCSRTEQRDAQVIHRWRAGGFPMKVTSDVEKCAGSPWVQILMRVSILATDQGNVSRTCTH